MRPDIEVQVLDELMNLSGLGVETIDSLSMHGAFMLFKNLEPNRNNKVLIFKNIIRH